MDLSTPGRIVLRNAVAFTKVAPLVWSANASREAGPKGLLRSQGQGACFQQELEANPDGQKPTRCGPRLPPFTEILYHGNYIIRLIL